MELAESALPLLPARTSTLMRRLFDDGRLLAELAHGLAGPFHVVVPEQFEVNLAAFRAALTVPGRVYYAKKANKAACWLDVCADQGVGVDVASVGELRDALGHGVVGADLVVTGPAKAGELLRLAILHGCLIAVDDPRELDRVIELGRQRRPGRVLLRCLPPSAPHSRFGLDDTELDMALKQCVAAGSAVRMEGFSFHLSGYDVAPRAELAARLVHRCLRARELGLPAGSVSIGGGFAVDYVDAGDWSEFLVRERPEWFHTGKRFEGFYPYHRSPAGAGMLTAVLDTVPNGQNKTLATQLREAEVSLLLEPGRALLDQAGCTVFTVHGVKDREYGILTVDGTSLSLSEQWFNSEFLPDPLLLPGVAGERPYPACVGGASCLESDMLTWRKILFPRRPDRGDLLVYPNTAGYQMDSNESPFHDLPLPPKVVVTRDGERLRWRLDRPQP